jgi:hypothetical protein
MGRMARGRPTRGDEGEEVMLDYEALSRLAQEQAARKAASCYPPGTQREAKEKELEQRYYRRMVYPSNFVAPAGRA